MQYPVILPIFALVSFPGEYISKLRIVGKFFFTPTLSEMDKIELKRRIFEESLKAQETAAGMARQAMEEANHAAQEEVNTLDIYESHRSQYLQKSEMFARQYAKALEQIEILKKANPGKITEVVEFGSAVVTQGQKMFIAIGLGKIKVDSETWYVISPQVPIFMAMKGKKAGEEFVFNNTKFKLIEVF